MSYRKTNFLNIPVGEQDPEEFAWTLMLSISETMMAILINPGVNLSKQDCNGLYTICELQSFLIQRTEKVP